MTLTQQEPSNRKLRIALFSGNYNYVMDGPVRALNMLVAYLEENGHEVLVFAPTTAKPAFQHSGKLISVPSVPLPGRRSEYRVGLGLRGRVRKTLEEFRPNLVHVAAPDYLGLSALKYARAHAIPAVASFHTRFDTYPRYYRMRWFEKYLTRYLRHFYRQCEHVYAPSRSMVDELRRDCIGVDVRLWTRGVDSELFNPDKRDSNWRRNCGFADDDVVIAFVGRLVLEKGIDLFTQAFLRVREKMPNARALIVGDGPERALFESKMPNAHFAGYLQNDDLARAYASADIFFNPSVTETFGNVTLEAMASQLPSVCASATGSKSLIEDGVTGLLAQPNTSAFADGLLTLIDDPQMRCEFGKNARDRALKFSWDNVLSELVDHYLEAVENFAPATASVTQRERAPSRQSAA